MQAGLRAAGIMCTRACNVINLPELKPDFEDTVLLLLNFNVKSGQYQIPTGQNIKWQSGS